MEVVPDDRWSQHPNIAFDLSVLDIYGALCAGAALVPIAEPADLLMPAKAIRRHQLTVWNSVPSVLTSMIRAKQLTARNFASLRLLTFCGEALQPMHLDGIFAARDDVVVHNTYGPTEATVSCTLARLVSTNYREACRATVAIGQPIPGMSLDIAGSADPREGELVITGPQLAEGYWNQPEATARQFRDFLKGDVMTRAYYTGDWARAIDGHIYFSGRMDNQVKVRGERIELDDIAAALMGCNLGFACVVMVGHSLHGVFERTEDLPAHAALAEMVGAHLPRHLIPQQFHQMPELPRSGNGKVDSAAVKVWLSTKMRISAIVDADFSVIADGVSG